MSDESKPKPLPPGKGYRANSMISQLKHENRPGRHFGGAEGEIQKKEKENADAEVHAMLTREAGIGRPIPHKN